MREKCAAATAVLFLLSTAGWSSETASLRGELTCEACNIYTDYVIELSDINGSRPTEHTLVRGTGDFEFQNIAEGNYSISVTSGSRVLKTEVVGIRGHGTFVTIRLPRSTSAVTPGGVVSIARLNHEIPKEARKQFNKAEDRMRKGDVEGSLAHLKRATEIDPEYVEAFNNLGCRYLMKKQPLEAIDQFRRALKLDPHADFIHSNMALALISAGQLTESEQFARRALSIDPRDDKGQYVLAISLYAQGKYTEESVRLLTGVSDRYPKARLALASTLAHRGDREGAKKVLNYHLSGEQVVERKAAEAMLSSLR